MRKRPSSPGRGLPISGDRNGGYASMNSTSSNTGGKHQRKSKIGRMLLLLNAVALLIFWSRSTSASSANDPRPLVLNGDGSVTPGEKGAAASQEGVGASSSAWSSSALGRRLGLLGGGIGSGGGKRRWSPSLSFSTPAPSAPLPPLSEEGRQLRDRALLDAAAARLGLALESPVVQAALGEAERLGRGGEHVRRPATTPGPDLDFDARVEARATELKAAPLELARGHDASRGRRGYYLSYVETDPLYPFQRIRFGNGTDSGVVAVIAPFYDLNYFRSETQRALFWRLKAAGHVVIGVSSYQEFPGNISNPHDDRRVERGERRGESDARSDPSAARARPPAPSTPCPLDPSPRNKPATNEKTKRTAPQNRHVTPRDLALLSHVDGWLHCFRPERAAEVIPEGVPRLLLSESDFTDPERRDGGGSLVPWGAPEVNKTWDLVYSDQGEEDEKEGAVSSASFLGRARGGAKGERALGLR